MSKISAREGLEMAIRIAGTGSALARMVKVSQPRIPEWRRKGYVPLEHVPAVSEATGLPKHVIRPDLPQFFPPPAHLQGRQSQQQEA